MLLCYSLPRIRNLQDFLVYIDRKQNRSTNFNCFNCIFYNVNERLLHLLYISLNEVWLIRELEFKVDLFFICLKKHEFGNRFKQSNDINLRFFSNGYFNQIGKIAHKHVQVLVAVDCNFKCAFQLVVGFV
ncbi:hypothetical protein D3C73_1371730 [compost metagenome]